MSKNGSKILTRGLEVSISIQNVVASARLNQRVKLEVIAKAFPQVEYRPDVFPGLPFKLKRPKSCTLIFNTGRMVCTGTKSEKEAKRAVLKVVKELSNAGIIEKPKKFEFAIQNIVASVDLKGVMIDVEKAVYGLRERVMYEPEQFPGAIYRMEDPKVVFLIFTTGKLVCVGAKREEEVYRAVENLVNILDDTDVLLRGSP
ncbi:TPA: TATA box-binding protein [Candidatus Bathyarchaeota archaeon]|nr:TATA box-binding protein [Candidatus Bathyarchaeota archaeon]